MPRAKKPEMSVEDATAPAFRSSVLQRKVTDNYNRKSPEEKKFMHIRIMEKVDCLPLWQRKLVWEYGLGRFTRCMRAWNGKFPNDLVIILEIATYRMQAKCEELGAIAEVSTPASA